MKKMVQTPRDFIKTRGMTVRSVRNNSYQTPFLASIRDRINDNSKLFPNRDSDFNKMVNIEIDKSSNVFDDEPSTTMKPSALNYSPSPVKTTRSKNRKRKIVLNTSRNRKGRRFSNDTTERESNPYISP